MAKPILFDESGDSSDLQALFDQIAAGAPPSPPSPPPAPPPARSSGAGDNDELQALFDNVAAAAAVSAAPAPSAPTKGRAPAGDTPDLEALFDSVAASVQASAPPVPPVAVASPRASAMGDSDELQDLFDSVAAAAAPPVPPAPPLPRAVATTNDSQDLQDLFDSVAQQSAGADDVEEAAEEESFAQMSDHDGASVFNQLGQLARKLHNSLRELGIDKILEHTARNQIPDARQRLTYIAKMTEQAASRVLNAIDIASPLQDQLIERSNTLAKRWDKMFDNQLSVEEFKTLAADSRSFFKESPEKLKATNEQLTEIMMAQDFQDLTGQVIKKVVEMAQEMEGHLLSVLIEAMPEDKKAEAPMAMAGMMNGPVIDPNAHTDVVTSQSQVDDLLESLGF